MHKHDYLRSRNHQSRQLAQPIDDIRIRVLNFLVTMQMLMSVMVVSVMMMMTIMIMTMTIVIVGWLSLA